MMEPIRRDGARLFYTVKAGDTAKLLSNYCLLVCHPERLPKLVKWDGSEELLKPADASALMDYSPGPHPQS